MLAVQLTIYPAPVPSTRDQDERGDRGFDHTLAEPLTGVDPRWRTISIRTQIELDRVARPTVIGPTLPGRSGQENEGHRAMPDSTGGHHWTRPALPDWCQDGRLRPTSAPCPRAQLVPPTGRRHIRALLLAPGQPGPPGHQGSSVLWDEPRARSPPRRRVRLEDASNGVTLPMHGHRTPPSWSLLCQVGCLRAPGMRSSADVTDGRMAGPGAAGTVHPCGTR